MLEKRHSEFSLLTWSYLDNGVLLFLALGNRVAARLGSLADGALMLRELEPHDVGQASVLARNFRARIVLAIGSAA